MKVLTDIGYEKPSPIQAQIIPYVLAGKDVVGQAQTGTGKTAAFALPLLSRMDFNNRAPQVLVLAPTRELANQVAKAFQKYGAHIENFKVLPIYGGQGYGGQLRGLQRGVHVVVGTPGRVVDHIKRGNLKLEKLACLVLDEADEMLRMGFIEDVEWILKQTPPGRQTALFSATIPVTIRRIAQQYLKNPEEITVKERTTTAGTIRQRFLVMDRIHKLDALTRILEGETFKAIIVFVKTKAATVEIAEKLENRGFHCSPINGDIPQNQRERTIERLRAGKLNVLVATDVAARGLDVDHISHVINYDIPFDTESYIHRIGRTGRAGRSGQAILFVTPRERRILRGIENATKQKIEKMKLPCTDMINGKRIARFKQRITDTLAIGNLEVFSQVMQQYHQEHNIPMVDIAAALGKLAQGENPLLLAKPKKVMVKSTKKTRKRPWSTRFKERSEEGRILRVRKKCRNK